MPTLDDLLLTADYAGLSDADAAALLSTPTGYVPRTERVTITTLCNADVWGFSKAAAFREALEAVKGVGGTNGAGAATLLVILSGPGFSTADPQVAGLAQSFVALSGGVISLDDAKRALGVPQYPAGRTFTADEVAAARAVLARTAPLNALKARLALFDSFAGPAVDRLLARALDGETVAAPTLAELVAQFDGQGE